MSSRRRYRAPDDATFAGLMQQRTLAGFSVKPMSPLEVRDRFLDTAGGALLSKGLVLRLRTYSDGTTATLRRFNGGGDDEEVQERLEGRDAEHDAYLPEGAVRAAVEERIGTAELEVLLSFRQYRTARALFEGDRLAGVLSLDVVADQTDPQHPLVSNEVEIELVEAGSEDDLRRLHSALVGACFEQDVYSKFERGFFRRELRQQGRLLLLPRERRLLEEMAGAESAVERRRADTLLMAAAGDDDRTISRRVGLAPSRVRHWREAFRVERTRLFDEDSASVLVEDEEPEPTFTVSSVVGDTARVEREPSRPADLDDALERVFHQVGIETSGGDSGPWSGVSRQPKDLPLAAAAGFASTGPRAEHQRPADEPVPFAEKDGSSSTRPEDAKGSRPVSWVPVDEASPFSPDGSPPFSGSDEPPEDTRHGEGGPDARPLNVRRIVLSGDLTVRDAANRLLAVSSEVLEQYAADSTDQLSRGAFAAIAEALDRACLAGLWVADSLPEQLVRRLSAEFVILVDRLQELADLHYAAESIDLGAAEERPPDERLALAMAHTVWSVEHRRALGAPDDPDSLIALVRRFQTRIVELTAALRSTRTTHTTSPLLKDVLGSDVWGSYERLRGGLRDIGPDDSSANLVRSFTHLEHRLSVIGDSAAEIAQGRLARGFRALTEYRRRRGLRRRLKAFTDEWLDVGGAADPGVLAEWQRHLEGEIEVSRGRVEGARAEILGHPFRVELAQAVASL